MLADLDLLGVLLDEAGLLYQVDVLGNVLVVVLDDAQGDSLALQAELLERDVEIADLLEAHVELELQAGLQVVGGVGQLLHVGGKQLAGVDFLELDVLGFEGVLYEHVVVYLV